MCVNLDRFHLFYHPFSGTSDAHNSTSHGEWGAKWRMQRFVAFFAALESSWHSWLFILHVTTLDGLSWPFSFYFFLSHRIRVPLLIALFSALRSLFLWFLVYFLFPTQAICPMRAKNNFVLITVDSEMPRTFSVRLREGDQEVFVKWSLTGQKCFA